MEFLFKKWSQKPIIRHKQLLTSNVHFNINEKIDVMINNSIENINTNNKSHILNDFIINYPIELINIYNEINKLNCKITYKNTIIGEGNFKSSIVFIIEYPENDLSLLIKMLNKIELKKEDVYIIYMFFWNKDSSSIGKKEFNATMPFVKKHILLHNPKIIITLGAITTKNLLNIDSGILSLRGQYTNLDLELQQYKVFITYNPSYVIKTNKYKEYEEDFQNLKNYLITNVII